MRIERGAILLVDLGEHKNSIQSGIRPCVVVSNDKANKHSTVITVVPLTSKIEKKRYLPTHVFINAYQCSGLREHSLATCEQITSISYERIIDVIGKVNTQMMNDIEQAMRIQVGM